jgi:hypothetical protein
MLCGDERERARDKISQFEQKFGLSRYVLKKGSSYSNQGANVALSGIYGCQRIDSCAMAVGILQDSNCAVKQLLAEHVSTYGHPRK